MRLEIGKKINNLKRVLMVTKKPERKDFMRSLRICLLGLFAVGFLGFIFYLIFTIFFGV